MLGYSLFILSAKRLRQMLTSFDMLDDLGLDLNFFIENFRRSLFN